MAAGLPRWDLSRFGFKSPFDSKLDAELDEVSARAARFKASFEGKLEAELLAAVTEYQEIITQKSKTSVYLSLSFDTALNDDSLKKRKGEVSERCAQFTGDSLNWFELDLATMEEGPLLAQYKKDPVLGNFKAFIDEARRQRPHNLSKDVERALTVRQPYSGKTPTVQFYDQELSLLRFDLGTEELKDVNLEVLLSRFGASKDAAFRRTALKTLNNGLQGSMARIAGLSLNSVCGSWHIENKERGFTNLRSSRNLDNNVSDAVIDSLLKGVRDAGVRMSKRYYGLKKEILKKTQGLEKFRWSDRNAPIDVGATGEEKVSWEAAVEMVEAGYRKFSPTMAGMFKDMIAEKRIDVPAVDHKKAGAYCHGVVPGFGPYQLLNFTGTREDITTLAHESGHGCHDILAYPQGTLQYHPPLTLAETASIFGEMIVFRDLLAKAPSKADRLAMLIEKIDDVVNSVVRQCSFDHFEELVHSARAKGDVAPEEMCKLWRQATVEYYGAEGEVFDAYDDISHLWAYVPHFHHVPFYVYSYAFADLVVGSLYHAYMVSPDGFEAKLLDLLRAGGTKDFVTALTPFGLEPQNPAFWAKTVEAHVGGLIDEAESLAVELGFQEPRSKKPRTG